MKGSILDVIIIPIVTFTLIIAVIFTYMFLDQFNTAAMTALPEAGQAAVQAGLDQYLFWDQAIIVLIGGLFAVTLVSAAMINAHPIFFVGAVMILIGFIFIGATLTNIFIEIVSSPQLAPTANLFPLTIQFFQNLPLFLVIMTISVAVVMFSFGGRRDGY